MEITNASVSPAIHIARALGVLSIEASLATSLACSLRWSTSCLTSVEELAGSPICVASASCRNSGMLGGLYARQSHHIAHPRYITGKIKLRTSVTCCPYPEPAQGLTSDVWKYVVKVNSSEMKLEGNLSFDPVCDSSMSNSIPIEIYGSELDSNCDKEELNPDFDGDCLIRMENRVGMERDNDR
ncbi:hypothetical protein RYX36_007396 [Vicia faba]